MQPSHRACLLAGVLTAAAALRAGPSVGEPVTDRALADVQVEASKSCAIVRIGFNFRIRYTSHFPITFGSELRIRLRPLDAAQAAGEILTRRESLRAPADPRAHVKAVELEIEPAAGPVLVMQFDKPVHYAVDQGGDFQSLVVAVAGDKASAACKPVFRSSPGWGGWTTTITTDNGAPFAPAGSRSLPSRDKTRKTGKLSDADKQKAAAALDEARAAIKKGHPAEAIKTLTRALALPENEHSAEAQELIGVARQRNNELAEARAEFEDYLARYPTGEGADRVRQRLAGVLTAQGEPPRKLRDASGSAAGRSGSDGRETWSVSGSASQFYIRDDSLHTLVDPSLPPRPNEDKDEHRVHQNVLLSSIDLVATWSSPSFKSKFRVSATEEHEFSGEERDIVSVAALYLELAIRDWQIETSLGRQTRNTGGVLGRFDGARVSWQSMPWMRLNIVGGSPVASRKDEPFLDDKYFYGASVDIGPFLGGLDLSLFAIEQRAGSVLDRQAIGAEMRYLGDDVSVFATIDYDIHFAELNAALLSGTWTLPDKSTLTGALEHRKSPYLTTWTALQGQPFLTLYDLLKSRTLDEVEQLAVDRSLTYQAASIGYARPLTDNLQVSLDVTAAETSGAVASGGIPALPASGLEMFYSLQLIANSMLAPGDLYMAGLRLADREDSNLYVLDLSARYPVTDALRISPRLRLGYREGETFDLTEYSVLPSVLLNYYVTRDLSLELEVGAKRTWTERGTIEEDDTELFLTVGFRYDFYADGEIKPACNPARQFCK